MCGSEVNILRIPSKLEGSIEIWGTNVGGRQMYIVWLSKSAVLFQNESDPGMHLSSTYLEICNAKETKYTINDKIRYGYQMPGGLPTAGFRMDGMEYVKA